MHYAQTNIQLFNQLREAGYSRTDLSLIRDAYELAIVLFSGRVQASGKTFIAHVVGTASILASIGASGDIVAAGLLHNVYQTGDFGDGRSRISQARRRKVIGILGSEVETFLAKFHSLWWNSPLVETARHHPEMLLPSDRAALVMIIADHLEHLQDLDFLYYGEVIAQEILGDCEIAADTADNLGLKELAAELRMAIQIAKLGKAPVKLSALRTKHTSSIVVPLSCRRRSLTMLMEGLIRYSRGPRQRFRRIVRFVRPRAISRTPHLP